METKMLKYEMSQDVVNYILTALNRSQIVGVQNAENLLAIVKLLQLPKNRDELEKDQYEALRNKFEPQSEEKKSKDK